MEGSPSTPTQEIVETGQGDDDLKEILGEDESSFQVDGSNEEVEELEKEIIQNNEKLHQEKDHLVVLVHGLDGNSNDLYYIRLKLESKFPTLLVHCASSNDGFLKTHDGIDNGGKRLAKEIEEILEKHKHINKFSIIGHSLGGLYARYCLGLLYEKNIFENILPTNFITLATPHLGSRRSQKGWLNPIINTVTRLTLSTTGKQLMLEDSEDQPILWKMAKKDSIWVQGLSKFRSRWLYANVANDIQVYYPTSAVLPRNPFAKKSFPKGTKNHVIEDALDYAALVSSIAEDDLYSSDEKKHFLRDMLRGLHSVEWNRVNVYFNSLFSHEKIVNKRDWMFDSGQDIVELLIEKFSHE